MVVAMTILAGVATLGLIAYVLCGARETWDLDAGAGRLVRLKKRRERMLRTMKDLETEREAGVITEEDFRALRGDYKRQAVQLSRELERVRRSRVRQLARGTHVLGTTARQRVEKLVKERKAALSTLLILLGLAGAALPIAPLDAGVTLTARVFDAEASFPAFRRELQGNLEDFEKAFRDDIKVPFGGRDLSVELIDTHGHDGLTSGRVLGTWQVRTDADGGFVLDTQQESLPPGAAFVASATDGASKLFTRFFTASQTAQSLMVYRTSDRDDALLASVEVTYDKVQVAGGARLRVQVLVQLRYRDYTMYVGKSAGAGGWREVFRIPFPDGAAIVQNRSPDGVSPGWAQSTDRRALVINSPVPGIYDSMSAGGWQVTYDLPARQTLVQTYDVPFNMEKQAFTAWCIHEDMAIESPQLGAKQTLKHTNAPVSSDRSFDVHFSGEPLAAGSPVQVWLTVDNAAIGQVSAKAVKWVGGFLLAFLVAILAGLVFGRGAPPPEVLYGDLSGEEVLDRIVDLDRRFEARRIREADYRRYREALVELAAEELAGTGPAAADGAGDRSSALTAVALPKEARDILRRIDELEEKSPSDPQVITERAHLLEALAKALPRETRSR